MTAASLTTGSPEMHRRPLVPDAAASEHAESTEAQERRKFPRELVEDVLIDLWRLFDPKPEWHTPSALCERMCAVGGFRRRKREMKDLELLYIPRVREVADPGDMFGAVQRTDLTERLIGQLLSEGVLAQRLQVNGSVSAWGAEIKHALHVPSGLPLDLFAATAENWFNRLVVTTGPVESNVRIATKARQMVPDWEWEVNSPGFVPLGGTWENCARTRRTMRSEREVFEFVGLECKAPEDRK